MILKRRSVRDFHPTSPILFHQTIADLAFCIFCLPILAFRFGLRDSFLDVFGDTFCQIWPVFFYSNIIGTDLSKMFDNAKIVSISDFVCKEDSKNRVIEFPVLFSVRNRWEKITKILKTCKNCALEIYYFQILCDTNLEFANENI